MDVLPTIVMGLAVIVVVAIVFGVVNPPANADHAGLLVRVGEVISPANPVEGRAPRSPWWLRRHVPVIAVLTRPEPDEEPAIRAEPAGRDWPRAA